MSTQDKLEELKTLAEALKSEVASGKDLPKDDAKDKDAESDEGKTENDIELDDAEKMDKTKSKEVKTESQERIPMDLGTLFEGQELSEEFKATATDLFESAVATRVGEHLTKLEEEYNTRLSEETAELKESLAEKVDGYLGYMVEQWMEKNELAINRGIKTDILESFVSGLKGVFESHYIDVPDEKFDLVEASQTRIEELESRLDEEVEKSVHLSQTLKEIHKQVMIDEAVEDMVATDAEKFRSLAEELNYSEDNFDKKLAVIKESYFSAPAREKSKPLVEEFMTDEPVLEMNEETKVVDSTMARYLNAIERSSTY